MPLARRHLPATALGLCLGLAAPAAWSQAFDAVRLFSGASADGGLVGAIAIAGTEYMGSDERRALVLPVLDYQWRNGWFAGTGNGVGYNFSARPDLQYGLRLTADFGRDEGRSEALRGLGDVDPAVEFGGFLNYFVSREVFLTSSLRYGAGNDANGLQVDLGAGYSMPLSPQLRWVAGVAATVVNSAYMRSYFGVDAGQSAASGYAVYEPGGGLRDVRFNTSLAYQIDARTSVTAGVSVSRLLGDAADSPIVRQASTVSGVLALLYAF
jgi:outer membrane scaffolding protein for murein synthesis (MipA/OmpV family)